jgi:5-methylcytosine-specific restriction endonuclease McrA
MKSEAWGIRRAQVIERDDKKCQACGKISDLHVHHLSYERLGEELDEDLVTLCKRCHFLIHHDHPHSGLSLADATRTFIRNRRLARADRFRPGDQHKRSRVAVSNPRPSTCRACKRSDHTLEAVEPYTTLCGNCRVLMETLVEQKSLDRREAIRRVIAAYHRLRGRSNYDRQIRM